MSDDRSAPSDPGEARALELLELVGRSALPESPAFTDTVVTRAARQRLVLVPLRAFAQFVDALVGGLRGLVATGSRDGDR